MKKILLFLFIFELIGVADAQDTVRYGDPWYEFNPLPNLIDTVHPAGGLFASINYSNGFRHRYYLGYPNNHNTIYGIAVVMDSMPEPQFNYIVTLLRGIEWHLTSTTSHPLLITIDSLYPEDTIKTWEDPLVKKCWFEYFYNYDSVSGDHKSSKANNCYEFYFDSPLKTGINMADTFFVGVNMYTDYDPNAFIGLTYTPKLCRGASFSTPYLGFIDTNGQYERPGVSLFHFFYWGGIFPIIERRCSVPRGLALSEDSLLAYWRSDTDATLFQLSVCNGMTEPDSGLLFTTSDTSQPLPAFRPDSTYRIYLRKLCDYRQDSVWSDWSDPLIIGHSTAAIDDIDNHNSAFSIALFPNPANSDITVTVTGSLCPVATLIDATGRVVIPPSPFHSSFIIPHSSLSSGVYFLRIHTDTGVASKKLIVK